VKLILPITNPNPNQPYPVALPLNLTLTPTLSVIPIQTFRIGDLCYDEPLPSTQVTVTSRTENEHNTHWLLAAAAAVWLCRSTQSLSLACCQAVQPETTDWISDWKPTEQNQAKVSEWNEHCAGWGYSVIPIPIVIHYQTYVIVLQKTLYGYNHQLCKDSMSFNEGKRVNYTVLRLCPLFANTVQWSH